MFFNRRTLEYAIYVLPNDVDDYLRQGYQRGRIAGKHTNALAGEGSEELAKEFEEDVL